MSTLFGGSKATRHIAGVRSTRRIAGLPRAFTNAPTGAVTLRRGKGLFGDIMRAVPIGDIAKAVGPLVANAALKKITGGKKRVGRPRKVGSRKASRKPSRKPAPKKGKGLFSSLLGAVAGPLIAKVLGNGARRTRSIAGVAKVHRIAGAPRVLKQHTVEGVGSSYIGGKRKSAVRKPAAKKAVRKPAAKKAPKKADLVALINSIAGKKRKAPVKRKASVKRKVTKRKAPVKRTVTKRKAPVKRKPVKKGGFLGLLSALAGPLIYKAIAGKKGRAIAGARPRARTSKANINKLHKLEKDEMDLNSNISKMNSSLHNHAARLEASNNIQEHNKGLKLQEKLMKLRVTAAKKLARGMVTLGRQANK